MTDPLGQRQKERLLSKLLERLRTPIQELYETGMYAISTGVTEQGRCTLTLFTEQRTHAFNAAARHFEWEAWEEAKRLDLLSLLVFAVREEPNEARQRLRS